MMRAPQTEPGVHVEGPPAGLPSGRFTVPQWSIAVAGALVVILGLAWVGYRLVGLRKDR